SITKLMSAVVIVENFNLSDTVPISPAAAGITGSKMHLLSGEQIKAKDLVNGMLIASANDAAKALEEHFGHDQVVKKMNQKTEFLNLKNSHFSEATGLDSKNKSSAQDLILLTKYALNMPIISEAVKTKEYQAVSIDGRIQHLIHTTNRLLKQYPDIFGVKTGYTEEAGSCLISAADRNGHQLISVVLGFDDYNQRFSESRNLLDWVFGNYNW
ncbi:MAG: D-alanyl-D-alanine carboxypeptidase, partial [Candidatus Magasanikbacteria bacterium CG10_big_fil_rev_8_21_14_0_10_40_10]